MQTFSALAALALALATAGCSSQPPPPPTLPSGAVPAGSASVAVAAGSASQFGGIECQPLGGSLTRVTAGNPSTGLEILLDNRDGVNARSVVITGINGFTGSYWKDAQGDAQAGMTDQTFTIEGTARGFEATNPSITTTQTFRVAFAC